MLGGLLILTIFFYMLVPVICLAINQGQFDKKSAKMIALSNSIIVGFIFFLVTVAVSPENTWSMLPAIFYYWINRSILTSKHAAPYGWSIKVVAINSNNDDMVTQQKELSMHEPVYFHLKLEGRNSWKSTKIYMYYTLPNGYTNMDTIEGEWHSGDCFSCGWNNTLYDDSDDEEVGELKCEFLDNDGHTLGFGVVQITE